MAPIFQFALENDNSHQLFFNPSLTVVTYES